MPSLSVITYEIDQDDRITSVSPEWIPFAQENDAPELLPDAVVGRLLWSYVAGAEVQHIYDVLFSKVRKDDRPLTFPFRCDGPQVRRFMQMTLRPAKGGALELRSALLREEPRGPIALLDAASPRSEQSLKMCAWCKSMPFGEDWVEVEEAIRRSDLFADPKLPQITHVICPTCRVACFGPD